MVCGLVVIAVSGCTTRATYTDIEPDRLEVLRVGQNAWITTHNEVLINNIERSYFELVVTDVNAERIQGDLVPYEYVEGTYVKEESVPVEVKAENIKRIERVGVWVEEDPDNIVIKTKPFWSHPYGFLFILIVLVNIF